ncbi:MAG TPA: FlgD immunoglobulin-like domain containing protein, partial [Candidatus Krumholzibacteria bacterium]|nr:FlgD immunoglobulin-like domain containing protein [Candidatus Krumholzibacteria bacterium]
CTQTGDQNFPATCPDGAGGAFVTWYDFRSGTHPDIYAQRLNAAGVPQWTSGGVAVCVATDDQFLPSVIADGAGGAIIAWHDGRTGGVNNADIYAQKLNAAGVAQWTADGVLISSGARNQFNPKLASDGAGGAIITWYDYRNNFSTPDIYAQRVNSAGVVQWLADGIEIAVQPGTQIGPRIVPDGAGGAVIVWLDFRSLTHYDVYAQRVNSAGAVQWGANGTAISTATGLKFYLELISDGSGGAIATWQDQRSGSADIYAQRVSSAGVALWAGDTAVCTDASHQDYPSIATDGAHGAVIAWEDGRVSGSEIYAQRINATGVVQWTLNGVAVCAASGAQDRTGTASDGAGGAIIVWQDRRSGDYDLYAQRINAAGVTQWTANGIVVTTASGEQRFPVAVSDGSGGAFLAWQDARNADLDIYAQRLNGSGSMPTAVGDTPSLAHVTISPNVPNPFSNQTAFDIGLPQDANAEIGVYDATGRLVRRMDVAGSRRMTFDGRDNNGRLLPSGVYFLRMRAEGETAIRKLVIAR